MNESHNHLPPARPASYVGILALFWPELVTAFVLYSLIYLVESYFVSQVSTSMYATLSVTNTMTHLITKIAEGLSIGTLILCGQYNGQEDYKGAGRALHNAFWTTIIVGAVFCTFLYFGAHGIYRFYGVEPRIQELGMPFLRLRSISLFLIFIYFALIAFLRSIKNTRAPMVFFVIGAITFIFFDYCLIFGACGMPKMELIGSGMASVVQSALMTTLALLYIIFNPGLRHYSIQLLSPLNPAMIWRLFSLSWPVILDKATVAAGYVWVSKLIGPMGENVTAAYGAIKDLERLAVLPAIALAQVATVLVSNLLSTYKPHRAMSITIQRSTFLSIIGLLVIVGVISVNPAFFIGIFDRKRAFSDVALILFPYTRLLVIFDVLQLLLSAGLRGMADVQAVMWVRVVMTLGFFIPLSMFADSLPLQESIMKFIAVYGLFYVAIAFMCTAYALRLKSKLAPQHSA